jgi:hypothetical protein
MKNGTRQRGVGKTMLRRTVVMIVIPRDVPIRKARREIPDSDFEPFG